jgi:hypothetical protein
MAAFGDDKLIPPDHVLEQELTERIESKVRAAITEQILEEADLEQRITDALAAIKTPGVSNLRKKVRTLFKRERDREWRDAVETVAIALIARKAYGGGAS